MKRIFCVVVCCCTFCPAIRSQIEQSSAGREVVTRQCSAIRELVYAAWNGQFSLLLEEQLRSSYGYQPYGTWKFETTRYRPGLEWTGADLCYIEHYEESTDSTHTDQWQYVAEYSHVPDVLEAERLFVMLNNEIEGCRYRLNDSVEVEFRPLPPEALPPERPSSLEIANLYEVPMVDSSANNKPDRITLMVGLEKRRKDYRVSLIVENLITKNPAKTETALQVNH